jgi:hypothetical protein
LRALPRQPPRGAPTKRTSFGSPHGAPSAAFIPAAPETVAAFLAAEAARGIKPASIGRRVAAIRYAHKLAGHNDPPTSSEIVKATVHRIRRSWHPSS